MVEKLIKKSKVSLIRSMRLGSDFGAKCVLARVFRWIDPPQKKKSSEELFLLDSSNKITQTSKIVRKNFWTFFHSHPVLSTRSGSSWVTRVCVPPIVEPVCASSSRRLLQPSGAGHGGGSIITGLRTGSLKETWFQTCCFLKMTYTARHESF